MRKVRAGWAPACEDRRPLPSPESPLCPVCEPGGQRLGCRQHGLTWGGVLSAVFRPPTWVSPQTRGQIKTRKTGCLTRKRGSSFERSSPAACTSDSWMAKMGASTTGASPPHPAQHPGSQAGPCLSSKGPSLVLARAPSNSSPPRVLVSVTLEVSDQQGEEAGSRPNLVPLGALPSSERRGELSQPKAQCDKAQWGTPVPAREHDETLAQGRERQRGGGEKSTCPHPGPVTWELCPQIASVAQGS